MAFIKPEEFLEQHGHLHTIEPEDGCAFLCNEYQNIFDIYDETPAGPRKVLLEKRLVAIAQQIKTQHCKCFLQ